MSEHMNAIDLVIVLGLVALIRRFMAGKDERAKGWRKPGESTGGSCCS